MPESCPALDPGPERQRLERLHPGRGRIPVRPACEGRGHFRRGSLDERGPAPGAAVDGQDGRSRPCAFVGHAGEHLGGGPSSSQHLDVHDQSAGTRPGRRTRSCRCEASGPGPPPPKPRLAGRPRQSPHPEVPRTRFQSPLNSQRYRPSPTGLTSTSVCEAPHQSSLPAAVLRRQTDHAGPKKPLRLVGSPVGDHDGRPVLHRASSTTLGNIDCTFWRIFHWQL